MTSLLRSVLRSVALTAVALTSGLAAQVVVVNGTGCAGSVPPTYSGSWRIGQTLTFTLQGTPGPANFVFLAMGYQSGNNIPFFPPTTCVPGPCNWYPAPFGTEFIIMSDPVLVNLALPIPNDRRLIFSTFSVQGGYVDGTLGCLTFSKAMSFAIAP